MRWPLPSGPGAACLTWRRRLARSGLIGLLSWTPLCGATAQAEIWGYVDAKGQAHFSHRAEDARYELYYRSLDAGEAQPDPALLALRAVQVPTQMPRLLAFMEVSPQYKLVQGTMREAAQTHGVDYALLQAVIATESGFDARAVSGRGAVGLMQIMPATASRYGVRADDARALQARLSEPGTNIRVGTRYLADLLRLFAGNLELALAAYNAGEGRIQRAGNKVPDIEETRQYVRTVLHLYGMLRPPGMSRAQAAPSSPPPLPAPSSSAALRPVPGGALGRANMVGPSTSGPLKLSLPASTLPGAPSLAETLTQR